MSDPTLADRLEAKHVRLRTMNGSGEWIDTRWCAGCGGQTEWPCDPYRAAARLAELEAELKRVEQACQRWHRIVVAEQLANEAYDVLGGTDE